jgi:hypothetical protein
MAVTLGGCYLALLLALATYATAEVSSSAGYCLLFLGWGAIATEAVTRGLAALGLDADADGLERNNAAARFTIGGAWIACTCCAIGANLGEGDELNTTSVPLVWCATALLAVACVVALATRGFAAVTVERERAAGLRLGAMFVAASIPLAHAASGDWVSIQATAADFQSALPSMIRVLGLALAAEMWFVREWRRNRVDAVWSRGMLPSAIYVLGAIALCPWQR